MSYHDHTHITCPINGARGSATIISHGKEDNERTESKSLPHVYMTINGDILGISLRMLPQEARALAKHLLAAAEHSELEPAAAGEFVEAEV